MSITGEPTNIAIPETTPAPAADNYVQEMNRLNQLRATGGISEYSYNKAKFDLIERERLGTSGGGEDVIGVGRYVLSFVMVGVIGLAIAFLLRKQGWTAIWVNLAAMFVVVAAYVALAG
jgi:hypothetical protein